MVRSRTIIASPPGATIKEQLVDRQMSQKEFARRMDMSEKHISGLINGEVQLTPDMAMRLEMVLEIPAHYWSRLESVYRDKLAKAIAENDILPLLSDILPLAMGASCMYHDHPEADESVHCCDWGPIVDRICTALGREIPEGDASHA